jgi:outer membrane protein
MKTTILGIFLTVFLWQFGFAQKLTYFESALILEEMPAFEKANKELDSIAKQWETEIENKFKHVDQLYKDYVKNEVSLSPESKQQKQQEIFNAEKQAKDFKSQKFGMDGEMSKLQEQRIKPLQDSVFDAAKAIAKEMGYDYVFDISVENSWVYLNEDYNITEIVKAKLGL